MSVVKPLFVTAIYGKIAYMYLSIKNNWSEVSVKFFFKGWSVAD
jgi:hypothetical protein